MHAETLEDSYREDSKASDPFAGEFRGIAAQARRNPEYSSDYHMKIEISSAVS